MSVPAVPDDLRSIGIEHPFRIIAALLLDEDGMRAFSADARLHTDDDPVLDHYGPFDYLFQRPFAASLEAALRHRPDTPGPLVRGVDAEEAAQLADVWRASRHWYEVLIHQARLEFTTDRDERLRLARRARDAAIAATAAITPACARGTLGRHASTVRPGRSKVVLDHAAVFGEKKTQRARSSASGVDPWRIGLYERTEDHVGGSGRAVVRADDGQ